MQKKEGEMGRGGEGERGRGGEGLTNSPFEVGDKGSRSISIGEGSIPFWLCSVVRSGAW